MQKILLSLLILLTATSLNSQINVTSRNYDNSNFPELSVEISVLDNFTPVSISEDNIRIIERLKAHSDVSLQDISNGWYRLTWIPDHNLISNNYIASIVVTYEKSTAQVQINDSEIADLYGQFVFRDNERNRIEEIQFGEVTVNDSSLFVLTPYLLIQPTPGGNQTQPVRLDSITLDSEDFSYVWRGNRFSTEQPPVDVIALESSMFVYFHPRSDGAKSAVLTLHYDSGGKSSIRLLGNKEPVEVETNLQLTEPNGGEYFTPCQDTVITWRGNVKNIPTIIEGKYSRNGNWETIGQIQDTSYNWSVPKKVSSEVKVRVRQSFSQNKPFEFPYFQNTVSVDYDLNATKMVSFSVSGDIKVWNMINLSQAPNTYNLNTRNNNFTAKSVEFVTQDRFLANYSVGNFDSVAVFEIGNSNPIKKERKFDYSIKEIISDDENRRYTYLPEFSNYLEFYNSETDELINEIVFNQPITSLSFAGDTNRLAVSGLDSKIYIINSETYEFIDTLDYNIRIIDNLSLSPNGKFTALTTRDKSEYPFLSFIGTLSMILDVENNNIISSETFSSTGGVKIDFSPTSNMAVFSFKFIPQIVVYDLVLQEVVGNIEATPNTLTDLDYAPEGNSLIVSSIGPSQNKMKQLYFTFPEVDESDDYFTIKYPEFDTELFEFEDEFIFNPQTKTFTAEFCNISEVPLLIDDFFFREGSSFSISNFSSSDTIAAGECIDIEIEFAPVDTGDINDELVLVACDREYAIPLNGYGLNRNLSFNNEIIDFGEVCIGDTNFVTVKIFTNDDPVPLKFNDFKVNDEYSNVFSFRNYTRDTVINQGEFITATVAASPDTLGEIISDYEVLHSDQEKYTASAQLRVIGIGTFVEVSHNTLPFIEEIRVRTLSITNQGETPFTLDDAILNSGEFQILTPLPLNVQPGETIELEIEWTGNTTPVNAELELLATPCLTTRFISLTDYNANSVLNIEDTDADPLDTTYISISYENTENHPYEGERFFEAYLRMNKRLFLPEYAESIFGNAEVENVEESDTERTFRVRVEGDFSENGELVRIIGYPGLSNTNETPVTFDLDRSVFFGTSTSVTTGRGIFRVITTCNDQDIQFSNNLNLESLGPNPATDYLNLEVLNSEDSEITITIVDETGKSLKSKNLLAPAGNTIFRVNTNDMKNGSYSVIISDGNRVSTGKFIIVR